MTQNILSNNTISGFIYELIKYLIEKQIFQPFLNCTIEGNTALGNYNVEFDGLKLTSIFKVGDSPLNDADLSSGGKIRYFKEPFHINSRFYYLSTQWTDHRGSSLDMQRFQLIFHKLYPKYTIQKQNNSYHLVESDGNLNTTNKISLPKPFLLLAGISGTGKTRFVREQVKMTGSLQENYCLTSVRPDWHEPSDLLGYISRLNGEAEYVTTDVLQFIAKAWRGLIKSSLELSEENGYITVKGTRDQLSTIAPYWLCLDEMNLAPVEQYFADYLSVLETIEWEWDGDDFSYRCDPLLKASQFADVKDKERLRETLGFESSEESIWELFLQYGMSLPLNLIVAGTVNMDETTHGFSRKVIDRAISIDFGEFFPNDYSEFFTPITKNKALGFPTISQASQDDFINHYDKEAKKSIQFLTEINTVLKNTPFELAYRALNELLLSVANQNIQDDRSLQAVWDDFMMTKVLPRIEGDLDKLQTAEGYNLLEELNGTIAKLFTDIWGNKNRPDIYRENIDASELFILCRSQHKLKWMQQRLQNAQFTSFWP